MNKLNCTIITFYRFDFYGFTVVIIIIIMRLTIHYYFAIIYHEKKDWEKKMTEQDLIN